MAMLAALIGRILLGALFIISGAQKIIYPASTAAYIESTTTLPGSLAMPTGIFEVVAGVLLAVGVMSRLVSVVLAVFTALTILFFHNQFTDYEQGTQALKNVALIGGLLMVFAYGQMRWSYDHMKAEHRVHDAELRAARAEARAEGRASVAHDHHAGVPGDRDGDGVADVRQRRSWWRY